MAQNLEVKIRSHPDEVAAIRARLVSQGLSLTRLQQVDRYFRVPHGRLKLRQITPERGPLTTELISYRRPDATGPRWSTYRRLPLSPADADELQRALTETIGVLVVVRKARDVALHGRTRIHLDDVADLGAFVELETVVTEPADDRAAADLAETATLIGIDPHGTETVVDSYADLLLARDNRAPTMRM